MKTRLLLLNSLLLSVFSFSQIQFSNLLLVNATHNTATVSFTLGNADLCPGSQYHLQYATTPSFFPGAVDNVYLTNNTNGVKTHTLTGLSPNTTYYFRVFALVGDACNTSEIVSSTATFSSTFAGLPIITVDSLTDVASTSVTINYTINSNGAPSTSTLYYGIAPNWNNLSVTGISVPSGQSSGQIVLSGLTPNTNYSYRFIANNDLGESVTAISTFQTTPIQLNFFNLKATNVTNNSVTVSVTLENANLCPGSQYHVQYATTPSFFPGAVDNIYLTGNTNGVKTHTLTGLLPNTIYYFRAFALVGDACNSSEIISSTATFYSSSLIADYNFNNTYNNVNGNTPFTTNTGTSFTSDRNGNTNAALNLVSIGTSTTIPNLPYGSSPRTISIWVKNYNYNWFVASACPFSYGTSANAYELAMYETSFGLNPYPGPFSHYVDLTPLNITNALNTWNHYVVSYNGTTSKIYKDGVLLSSSNVALTTANNSDIFRLGLLNTFTTDYFDGAIDDLKIYNYAVTDADVTSLYTNNTLSSSDFSQNSLEVKLYPNPVRDILNIEIENDIQSVEIYNIQGQKVISSNQKQINISDLASGMYMVRIQDVDNNIATEKIVIK